jgi:hypothetical protein
MAQLLAAVFPSALSRAGPARSERTARVSSLSPALPVGVLALALLAGVASADERILSFRSRIEVLPDASLRVTETLQVRSERNRIKRGIFREVPTTYVDTRGNRMTLGFELLSVRRDAKAEPYHTEQRSNGIAIYAGRKDVLLAPGEYTYEIAYRELGFFADHDELYWNVTGNGWEFAIDAASARLVAASCSGWAPERCLTSGSGGSKMAPEDPLWSRNGSQPFSQERARRARGTTARARRAQPALASKRGLEHSRSGGGRADLAAAARSSAGPELVDRRSGCACAQAVSARNSQLGRFHPRHAR